MSIRDVGSYIGYNRVTSEVQDSASGIWSLAAAERRRRAAAWPMPVDLTTNLLGYWSFDSNANDASGNGYNLTSTGSPTSVAGRVGNGFNASAGQYYYNDNSAFNPTTQYSLTANVWFRRNGSMSEQGYLLSTVPQASPFAGWALVIVPSYGANKLSLFRSTFGDRTSTASVTDNNWHMATYVENRTAGVAQLWIDGVKDKEITGTSGQSVGGQSGWLTIGYRYLFTSIQANGGAFPGDIDEVAIWSRALSQGEIEYLYAGGNGVAVL